MIPAKALKLIGKSIDGGGFAACIIGANLVLEALGIEKRLPERDGATGHIDPITDAERIGWENKVPGAELEIGDVLILYVWSQYHVLVYIGDGYAMHYVKGNLDNGVMMRVPVRRVQRSIREVWR